jgi:hypothetical protein
MDEIFDLAGFIAMRERGHTDELHLKAFLSIFMKQPVFENYMLSRAASAPGEMDALDRAVFESRSRRAWHASRSHVVKVQELGEAFKAKMGSHSNSLWGPNSWKRRVFELHHLTGTETTTTSTSTATSSSEASTPAAAATAAAAMTVTPEAGSAPPSPARGGGGGGGGGGGSSDGEGGDEGVEMLSLTYYQLDPSMAKLKQQIEELKVKEKSSKEFEKLKHQLEGLERDMENKKKKYKKGEMILRKGHTSFQIPDSGKVSGNAATSVSGEGQTAAAAAAAAAAVGGVGQGDYSYGDGSSGGSGGGGGSSGMSTRGLTLNIGGKSHRTAFAFEIHVQQHGGAVVPTQILTICCDSHKERRQFIRTLQNALVTKAEVRE